MESGVQQGRPPRNLDVKVELFRRFESGDGLEEVKASAGVPEHIVYEAYRAFQIAQKSKAPINGSDQPGGSDQPAEQVESNHNENTSVCSATTTSGDKAS